MTDFLEKRSPPTFLGIGSMRCGSTWLYQVLKCHPDIQVSEFKEVDFFFLRPMLYRDFEWYEALFQPNDGCELKPIRGEISPGYARLKAWQVNRVAKLMPHLRILLTLRHPIERAWSQTLYSFGHLACRDIRKVGTVEFLRQLERARSRLSSNYVRIVNVWSNAFGREALHIGLFDELRNEPQTYVNGVLKHIGASTPWTVPEKFMKTRVFSTDSLVRHERQIPEIIRWYIADRLLEPTERLNEVLDGRVQGWVEEMRAIRGRTRLSWRVLRDVNRAVLSIPERVAYEAYHVLLDLKLWLRWRQLHRSYLSCGNLDECRGLDVTGSKLKS
jgi:hypothetical protein